MISDAKFLKYVQLRGIVDVLYDIQDVRMRTDNRLRVMPKETSKLRVQPLKDLESDLTKQIDVILQDEPIYTSFLQKVRGVGPRISGTIIAQTMIKFVPITEDTYKVLKKHYDRQEKSDAQLITASHQISDTHAKGASQEENDTHFFVASQDPEVQEMYSKEQFELAQKTANGGYLIPAKRGIEAFDTCSKYWAWWGLHVIDGSAAKRKKGQQINWNPKMKTLAWKIGKQFVMQGLGYRQLYDHEKDRLYDARMPLGKCHKYAECVSKLKTRKTPSCKGHIDSMAKRKAVKMFISHLYEAWRNLENLPTRPPYVLEYGSHTTYRGWEDLPDFMDE